MRVTVTGADGFVGRHALTALLAAGHDVLAAGRAGTGAPPWSQAPEVAAARWTALELDAPASVAALAAAPCDAVLHLAALASGREARRDPGAAWVVNAAGTARLLEAFGDARRDGVSDPRVLVVSTGEAYGDGPPVPRTEAEPARPVSPYAASKVGAEVAAAEVGRRTGLRVVVARPFTHTGPGQTTVYALPAFAAKLAEARRTGAGAVTTGDLSPIRDVLDVRDVARAYVALLERGVPGEIYNVASGEGRSLATIFAELARRIGTDAMAERDPGLTRQGDLAYLVGDPAKLRRATGWTPNIPFTQTLQDLVDAQAD